MHCFSFVKGTCVNGDNCSWAHLTAEEVAAKAATNKAKAKAKAVSSATHETAVVTASPCVAVFKDDQEDGSYATAVVCAEVCALIEDDEENNIPIGRKRKHSKITAPRKVLMLDEFTETKTKDRLRESLEEECGKYFVHTKVPQGYLDSDANVEVRDLTGSGSAEGGVAHRRFLR